MPALEENELHRPRGRSAGAGDHLPGGQLEHRGGQQSAGKQDDERSEQSRQDAGPHPARRSRNTASATRNAIATVISAP